MIAPYVLVLARTTREGRRYAKLAGLPKGRYRVVHSAKQIRRVRNAEVHELPGWSQRPDRHAVNAALRFNKGQRKQVTMPADVDTDPRGPLTVRQLEVAYRYQALRDREDGTTRIVVQAVSDDTEPPASHTALVERVLPTPFEVDDEEFCDDCKAGLESSEHHEKCEIPARQAEELGPLTDEVRAAAEDEWLEREHLADFQRGVGAKPPLEASKADDQERSQPTIGSPVDQGDGMGEQLTVDGAAEPVAVPEPPKRRRSKCADCGQLHFKGEPCPAADVGKPVTPSNFFG